MCFNHKVIYIILTLVLVILIVNCSGMYNPVPLGEYIEESDGDIEDEEIQGDSYLVATNEEIDESIGELEEEPVIGTDVVIIIKVKKNDDPKTDDDSNKINKELTDENKEPNSEDHKTDGDKKEELTEKPDNKDAKEEDIEIVDEKKDDLVDDEILIEDDKNKTDELPPEDVENFEGLHDYEPEDYTDEIDPSIEGDIAEPEKIKPLPVNCSLGKVFTLSSKNKKIIYLFFEMLPSKGMPNVEIGKDALKMLINSVLLIVNSPKKIGRVNYVVVGVEMYKNKIWYFMASYGDLVAFHKGHIDIEELTERITIKKVMPNIFKD